MFGRVTLSLDLGLPNFGLARLPVGLIGVVLAGGLLSACGSFTKTDEMVSSDPPDVIYGRADKLLDKHSYGDAAKEYEKVDINHPYSQEARRAIVMAAFAHYQEGKYDDAISAADRYLTLHPGTKESDLAQNIIAMSYYDQVLDPKRDQTNAHRSLQAYLTLLQRYPESRYAADAQNRVRILRDLLAASEMTVGRFYCATTITSRRSTASAPWSPTSRRPSRSKRPCRA